MKPSNILLTALLAITFCFCFGSSLVLKSEFQKRDLKDQYFGFDKHKLKPFKYLKVSGEAIGNIGLHQGKEFQVYTKLDTSNANWSYRGDTLLVQFRNGSKVNNNSGTNTTTLYGNTNVHILVPSLAHVETDGVTLDISDIKLSSLDVISRAAPVWIYKAQFDTLTADINQANMILQEDARVGTADIKSRKSSSFVSHKMIPNFNLDADSTTMIQVPAAMFQKALQ